MRMPVAMMPTPFSSSPRNVTFMLAPLIVIVPTIGAPSPEIVMLLLMTTLLCSAVKTLTVPLVGVTLSARVRVLQGAVTTVQGLASLPFDAT